MVSLSLKDSCQRSLLSVHGGLLVGGVNLLQLSGNLGGILLGRARLLIVGLQILVVNWLVKEGLRRIILLLRLMGLLALVRLLSLIGLLALVWLLLVGLLSLGLALVIGLVLIGIHLIFEC